MERVELATDWGREVRVHSVIHICIHTLNGREQAIGVYTLVDRSGKHPFFFSFFFFFLALHCLMFASEQAVSVSCPFFPLPPPPPPPNHHHHHLHLLLLLFRLLYPLSISPVSVVAVNSGFRMLHSLTVLL